MRTDSPRYVPLRYQFILLTTVMLVLILTCLAVILSVQQSRTIRRQIEQQGISIARSLAAASMANLLTYNTLALERAANQVAQSTNILYVIIHDKEGRVAGYSGRPDLLHRRLQDPASLKIAGAASTVIQRVLFEPNQTPGLDVALPVFPPGSNQRWGIVRVCLSLTPMQSQIRQMQWVIGGVGLIALSAGVLMSIWTARRITRPLGVLVQGTQAVAQGDLEQPIEVHTGNEIEELASYFRAMVREILAHRSELEHQLSEIRRLQQYTEQLLATMEDGLLSIDFNGSISAVNPAAQSILDPPNLTIGSGCAIADAMSGFPELQQYVRQILTTGRIATTREIRRKRVNGEEQTVLVGASIMHRPDGTPFELIVNLNDVTALKKLEAAVRQSERLAGLGTLAAGMAHEIRNPLSTIKTFVQLLPRKIDKPGFLAKFQRTVPRELERMNRLVQELLELSRVPRYRFEKTMLRPLLDQVLDGFAEDLQARRIILDDRVAEDLPPIRADAAQLLKAFQNIVQNAIQAMPQGGRLIIESFQENERSIDAELHAGNDRCVVVAFSDTGIGIDAACIDRIFNPFFTTKDVGTGLGLSITHKVISEHNGTIEVSSQNDAGTQIRIRLPVLSA